MAPTITTALLVIFLIILFIIEAIGRAKCQNWHVKVKAQRIFYMGKTGKETEFLQNLELFPEVISLQKATGISVIKVMILKFCVFFLLCF